MRLPGNQLSVYYVTIILIIIFSPLYPYIFYINCGECRRKFNIDLKKKRKDFCVFLFAFFVLFFSSLTCERDGLVS